MAYGDYIHCCKCDVKLIYDGDRSQREWWADRFDKEPEIECPDCKTDDTALLRQALEALEIYFDAYPHMQKGYVMDAIVDLRAALAEQPAEQEPLISGETSDGYHTFSELYEFRRAYNAALFNEWAASGKYSVHKSWRHHDGEMCFGGGWFIVVAMLPDGQISNHYAAADWDLFRVPETEKAIFEFDGHTGDDVVVRLRSFAPQPAIDAALIRAQALEEAAGVCDNSASHCHDDGLLQLVLKSNAAAIRALKEKT